MKKTLLTLAVSAGLGMLSTSAMSQSFPDKGTVISSLITLIKFKGTADEEREFRAKVTHPELNQAVRFAERAGCEQAWGSLVVGTRESDNGRLVHNNAVSSTACKIKNSRVINSHYDSYRNVWVVELEGVATKNHAINGRILSESRDSKNVDGNSIVASVTSAQSNLQDASNVSGEVLLRYPRGAFDVYVISNRGMLQGNQPTWNVRVRYDFNHNFLNAMKETRIDPEVPTSMTAATDNTIDNLREGWNQIKDDPKLNAGHMIAGAIRSIFYVGGAVVADTVVSPLKAPLVAVGKKQTQYTDSPQDQQRVNGALIRYGNSAFFYIARDRAAILDQDVYFKTVFATANGRLTHCTPLRTNHTRPSDFPVGVDTNDRYSINLNQSAFFDINIPIDVRNRDIYRTTTQVSTEIVLRNQCHAST